MLNPKFGYGEEVRLITNIRNDGSFQNGLKGECLMRRGETGFVRHAGLFLQDQVVYQIHFLASNQIIGCKETELMRADQPWVMNAFEYGDKVFLTQPLAMQQKMIAERGDRAFIIGVQREDNEQENTMMYRIQVNEFDVLVPESALTEQAQDIAL